MNIIESNLDIITYRRWLSQSASDHSRHQRNVIYRAIAEVVLHDSQCLFSVHSLVIVCS